MLIGSTGWATFMQIGTSTNEEAMALLVLLSFYLLLKEIFVSKSGRWQVYFGSGFILGSAMGLKLTVVIYCISTGLSLILFYKEIVKTRGIFRCLSWEEYLAFCYSTVFGCI